jgi:hypothetical protein
MTKDRSNMLCVGFSWMLLSFVTICKMITKDRSNIRRVPLLPHFDKPAFSRMHQTFQPRFVVHNFGEFVKRRVCQNGGGVARPRNPRIPIALFVNQTAFRTRMSIFKSGISGSGSGTRLSNMRCDVLVFLG